MAKIIQNAVYIPEAKAYLFAPNDPESSQAFVYDDGLSLIIGGGFESVWRDGNDKGVFAKLAYANRYEEFALNDEYPIEFIRDRLLWRADGWRDDESRPVGALIKVLIYPYLLDLLEDKSTIWPTEHHKAVVQYWADQKENIYNSGN